MQVPGTGYSDLMDFWQRGANMWAYLKTIYIHHRIVLRRLDAVFQVGETVAFVRFFVEFTQAHGAIRGKT